MNEKRGKMMDKEGGKSTNEGKSKTKLMEKGKEGIIYYVKVKK